MSQVQVVKQQTDSVSGRHVHPVVEGETLNQKIASVSKLLKEQIHCPKQYFEVGDLLIKNISSEPSPEYFQEYEVWKKFGDSYYKFESLTVTWMTVSSIKDHLVQFSSPKFNLETLANYGFGIMANMSVEKWTALKARINEFLDNY